VALACDDRGRSTQIRITAIHNLAGMKKWEAIGLPRMILLSR